MQSSASMTAVLQTEPPQLERLDGAARIVFAQRETGTAVADLYQRAPCRVMFPNADDGDVVTAALVTTSGGLTGGDRLAIGVMVGEAASAAITTQAAEKIYRSLGDHCSIAVGLNVAPAAWAEWLMQETILFDGARLSRRIEADVAEGGRLLAVESLIFGRAAMGEAFRRGSVHDVWRIKRGGRLVWVDALKLNGDVGAERARPFGFGSAAGCATLIYVGQDAGRWLSLVRDSISTTRAVGGATSFDGLLVVRLVADDAADLRRAVTSCITGLRREIAGLPARMPRLWGL